MKISKQGNNYEADEELENDEEFEDDEGFEDDEDLEGYEDEDSSASINTIFGLPKKFVFLGAAGLFVIIALVAVMNLSKKPKTDAEETTEEATDSATDSDEYYSDDYIAEFDDYATEDTEAQTDYTAKDIIDSDEEATLLGTYGYTGSEIEMAQSYGLSAEELVANAKSRQEASIRSTIRKLSDTGSIEYQNLINQTYLGQTKNTEPVDQTQVENPTSYDTTQTINADYVKCSTYGLQLFLKCKIYDGIYVWYQVTPQRWVSLPESGNIVLSVTLQHYGDTVYVTDIHETSSSPGTDSVQADNVTNLPTE